MSYDRPSDSSEYGGGGRGSDNYYNQSNDFSDNSQSYGRQGGPEYNSGGGYGYGNESSGDNRPGFESNDWNGVQQHAENHAGSSGDSSIFGSVLSHLQNNASNIQNGDVDERHAIQSHQQLYGGQGGGQHSSQSIGAGAAMQALKMFTTHESSQGDGLGGGGGQQNKFIGLAMAEASKLWDQQNSSGNLGSSADKQSTVSAAGEMAMKMYLKSQMGGGGSGLMGLASKFM